MHFEGDGPASRPPADPPDPVPLQHVQVTPENVVELAVAFRSCADILGTQLAGLDDDLRLTEPWMDDLVSEWAQLRFNEYFLDGEYAFATVLRNERDQYEAMCAALIRTAELYGRTDELIAAGIVTAGQPR